VCRLKNVEDRRRLRQMTLVEIGARRKRRVEHRCALDLQPLGFIRADDSQPDGGGEHTASRLKQKQSLHHLERELQRPARGAGNRRVMSATRPDPRLHRRQRRRRPDPSAGRGKRSALHTACAVRHGIRQKRVGERVERLQPCWRRVGGVYERQRAASCLADGLVYEPSHRLEIPRFPAVPCGFKTGRMRERTGREGGVGELPQTPGISHDRGYRI
jgi:hypothetical protein